MWHCLVQDDIYAHQNGPHNASQLRPVPDLHKLFWIKYLVLESDVRAQKLPYTRSWSDVKVYETV